MGSTTRPWCASIGARCVWCCRAFTGRTKGTKPGCRSSSGRHCSRVCLAALQLFAQQWRACPRSSSTVSRGLSSRPTIPPRLETGSRGCGHIPRTRRAWASRAAAGARTLHVGGRRGAMSRRLWRACPPARVSVRGAAERWMTVLERVLAAGRPLQIKGKGVLLDPFTPRTRERAVVGNSSSTCPPIGSGRGGSGGSRNARPHGRRTPLDDAWSTSRRTARPRDRAEPRIRAKGVTRR